MNEKENRMGSFRVIKFRAWDEYNKRMLSVYNLRFGDNGVTVSEKLAEFRKGTVVMQYTGLKDKNGKEIYEGDIVKENLKNQLSGEPFEVSFINGQFCAKTWNPDPASLGILEQYSLIFMEVGVIPLEYEIIGNIYENPELIKNND